MKKITLTTICAFIAIAVLAQAPQGISHQAVIRDAGNQLVTESSIGIQVSIIQESPEGTVVYSETHLPISNANGLISFVIGAGTIVSGVFAEIDWANGPYFIETEADPAGGTNYTIEGVSQVLSVPYALHSKTAESLAGSIESFILPPVATILPATDIETYSATLNGLVNAKGFLTDVIFEWGTTTAYGNTINAIQSHVTGSTDVMVSANLSNLQANITYHYRIRATNAVNVSYSDNMPFTTEPSAPLLTTNSVTNNLGFSATSGGNITYDGGSPVTARGVVWSTNPDPTLDDNFTVDGAGTGSFTSEMTGLTHLTPYYVRAYANNAVGTTYGNQLSFTTYAGTPGEPCIGSETITDVDGNIYNTVVIAYQCWMKENLKTTKYRNETPIEHPGADNSAWQNNTIGAYAWYDNDISWKDSYGALYNWHAVNNANGLCPTGWHVPTGWHLPMDSEFGVLSDYLGGTNVAGGKMKSTRTAPDPHPRWESPNTDATNESNWSGLPGGFRVFYGLFGNVGLFGFWWSSTETSSGYAWSRYLYYNDGGMVFSDKEKQNGFSVRCLRD